LGEVHSVRVRRLRISGSGMLAQAQPVCCQCTS